jgi:hypothetical protein
LTTIDGLWPDDSLVGGRRTLRATTRTLGLAALANRLHLLQSARYAVLAFLQKAATTIWTIIAHVERGFADFAEIPYQDAFTHRELSQLLDELEAEHHTDQSLPGVRLENRTVRANCRTFLPHLSHRVVDQFFGEIGARSQMPKEFREQRKVQNI